jgi:hypothetical protein
MSKSLTAYVVGSSGCPNRCRAATRSICPGVAPSPSRRAPTPRRFAQLAFLPRRLSSRCGVMPAPSQAPPMPAPHMMAVFPFASQIATAMAATNRTTYAG